jgi:hypothetical protein
MPRPNIKHRQTLCVACGDPATVIVRRTTGNGWSLSLCDRCTPTSDIRILERL